MKHMIALGASSLATALAVAALPAIAQDYQGEAGVSYLRISPDVGPSDYALGLDFTWHLDRVATQGHPLAEASFLSRASNLSIGYASFDKADLDVTSLGAEFYLEDFYLAASYDRLSNGGSSNEYGLSAGMFIAPTTLIRLDYGRNSSSKVDSWGVGFKTVSKMVGDTALNIEGNFTMVDDAVDTKLFNLSGDYYFNPMFSAGIRYTYDKNDLDSDSIWGVGASMFFTPTFSGAVEYSTDGDDDVIGLRLALRF